MLGTAFIYTLSCSADNVPRWDVFFVANFFDFLFAVTQYVRVGVFVVFVIFCPLDFFVHCLKACPSCSFPEKFYLVCFPGCFLWSTLVIFLVFNRFGLTVAVRFVSFAVLFAFSVCLAVPFRYLIVSNTNCYTYIRLLENFV